MGRIAELHGEPMAMDSVRKKVLVLSDNEGLSRAIEVNLAGRSGIRIERLGTESLEHPGGGVGDDACDLIVVAMSSPASEPVIALSRASLADRIGRIPLLIVSYRPFESDPTDRITHLDFPFDIDGFHQKVNEILQVDEAKAVMC